MKIRHIYTVIRESEITTNLLKEDIKFFKGAMQDDTGEYLYGGPLGHEEITVSMEIFKKGKWEKVI